MTDRRRVSPPGGNGITGKTSPIPRPVRRPRRRLFVALWPSPQVRARLAAACEHLPLPGRRVPVPNLHITLQFLGSVEEPSVAVLRRALAGVRAPVFDLALERLGWWRRGGIVWLGPGRTEGAVVLLQQRVAEACRAVGLPGDRRPFRAHLTLARRAGRPPAAEPAPVDWPVESFELMESRPGDGPPRYTVLASWPLTRT